MSQPEAGLTSIEEIGAGTWHISYFSDHEGEGGRLCEWKIEVLVVEQTLHWEQVNEVEAREAVCKACLLNARLVFAYSFGDSRDLSEA